MQAVGRALGAVAVAIATNSRRGRPAPHRRSDGAGAFLKNTPFRGGGVQPEQKGGFQKTTLRTPFRILSLGDRREEGVQGAWGEKGCRWLAVGLDQPKGEGGRSGSVGFPRSPPGGGRFSRGKTLDGTQRAAAAAASRVAGAMRMGPVWGQGGTVGSSGANPPTKMPARDKLSEASNYVAPANNAGVSDPYILLCITKHRKCEGNYIDSDEGRRLRAKIYELQKNGQHFFGAFGTKFPHLSIHFEGGGH